MWIQHSPHKAFRRFYKNPWAMGDGRWAVGKREAQADNAASNQSISELNTHRTRKRELRGGVEKEWRLRLNSKLRPALRTPEVAQRTAAFCVARPLLRIRYLCKEANVVGNAVKK